MSAESVIYYLNRLPANDQPEDAEWLFAALSQYTGAELRELLYTAQEPDFFDLMRGLFALPEHTRAALLAFLSRADTRPVEATVDAEGRCVLQRGVSEPDEKASFKLIE